jgi:uncharacterized membrane protein YukC
MEPEEGGFTIGWLIAVVGAIMFMAYIYYRISLQREELRDTIRLITDEHDHFIDDLQTMVRSGTVRPVSGNS